MSSLHNDASLPTGDAADKESRGVVPATVKFHDARLEKLVRLAAVERNTSRSAFMVVAAVREAREVLKLQREDDFQAYLAREAA